MSVERDAGLEAGGSVRPSQAPGVASQDGSQRMPLACNNSSARGVPTRLAAFLYAGPRDRLYERSSESRLAGSEWRK